MARATIPSVQNLFTYSEQFDNGAWATTNTSVTANQIANPVDGLTTADQIFETAGVGNHMAYRGITSGRKGSTMTLSVYAKDNNRQYICLSGNDAIIDPNATFDLVNGTITNRAGSTLIEATITAVGGGWYRCSITFSRAGLFNYNMIYLNNGSGAIASYAGDTGKSVYLFGAQLTEANWEGPYVQTVASAVNTGNIKTRPPTVQNLLIYSEQFDNAAWNLSSGVVVTANAVTAPDGTMTADELGFAGGDTSFHLQTVSSLVAGRTYTFSVWLYTDTKVNIAIVIRGTITNTPLAGATITLTGGWKRYSHTITLPTGDNAAYVGFENRIFAGADGLEGNLYAWGAQLTEANWAGTYAQTAASAVNTGGIRNQAVSRQTI